MLPLRIDERYERVPWATLGVAAVCGLAFLWSLSQPERVVRPLWLAPAAFAPWQLVTAMFLHASVFHLAGNLVFLLVFGRYVERETGPWRFLALYVGFGLAGDLAFLLTSWITAQAHPAVGASGAISGLMGFTVAAVPRARIVVFWFPGRSGRLPRFPVALYLALWVFLQLPDALGTPYLGLAWTAHLGGFLVGVGVSLWLRHASTRGSAWHVEPDPDAGSPGLRRDRRRSEVYRAAAEELRAQRGGDRVRYEVAPRRTPPPLVVTPPVPREESPRRSREGDWTLAEGIADAARFLTRRLFAALPLSVLLQGGICAPMSRLPDTLLLFVIFGLVMGMALGALLTWRMIDRIHFVGWIPTILAGAAAAVAIFGGHALAALWQPIQGDMARAAVLVVLSIGAAAAVYRFTGLD